MKISKITLGTAQLGLEYGIANITGKPSINESIKILDFAWKNGIHAFDTAPAYGNSEKIIGSFISRNKEEISEEIVIISKLPTIDTEENLTFDNIYSFIKRNISQSLKELKIRRLPIYLLHRVTDLDLKDGIIIDCLNQIKNEELIEKFGVSVYNPEDVEKCLNFREIDVIQVPINLLDNRLIQMGLLKKLKQRNYIIFARSIYLQGLLFLSPEKLPKPLEKAGRYLTIIREIQKELGTDIATIAFLYVRDMEEITSLVIGSESIDQVSNNIKILKEKPLSDDICKRINEEFKSVPEQIINPTLWNK